MSAATHDVAPASDTQPEVTMLPGPDQVIACPHCGNLARQPTLASGNTYHAQLWSDGKLDAPMLPEYPAITRCRGCRTVFWIRDAPVIDEIGPWGEDLDSAPAGWQAAERDVQAPLVADRLE
jgi:hypothetical protein